MKKLTKEQRKEMALKEYLKITITALKEYEKITNTAYEICKKKIKEIYNDYNEPEEIPEIIEQNGRKYRLVEE